MQSTTTPYTVRVYTYRTCVGMGVCVYVIVLIRLFVSLVWAVRVVVCVLRGCTQGYGWGCESRAGHTTGCWEVI
jgi:hypothetical protein